MLCNLILFGILIEQLLQAAIILRARPKKQHIYVNDGQYI